MPTLIYLPLYLQAILVFIAVIALDLCWAGYIARVGDGKAHKAGLWSSCTILLGAYAAISYVHTPVLVASAACGAYVGTFIGVRFKNRAAAKEQALTES